MFVQEKMQMKSSIEARVCNKMLERQNKEN